METKLTEEGKEICRINWITTDEDLDRMLKTIKLMMRLEHGIKAKESNKLTPSEILEWMVEQNRKNPATGQ